MYHSGLTFGELFKMDVESFNGLIKRINENNTGVSELTEAQKDMVRSVGGNI